ncbi:hypothetical protein SUGI_0241730 [Cryptomeria japonica]|nr:hypothetical protein SUGI_0241730 [Cryptomeria japonica]
MHNYPSCRLPSLRLEWSGPLQLLLLTASSLVFKRPIASAVFGDNPPISQDVLANAFNVNDQQIKELISEQGSPTAPAPIKELISEQGSPTAPAPIKELISEHKQIKELISEQGSPTAPAPIKELISEQGSPTAPAPVSY